VIVLHEGNLYTYRGKFTRVPRKKPPLIADARRHHDHNFPQ